MNALRLPPGWERTELHIYRIAAPLLVLWGTVLRLLTWLQNRNLIVDEANIARNLRERSFSGLLHPLDYEQYAPPLFLWMEKATVLAGGYGEMALRFPALLAGLAAIPVFVLVARRYMTPLAALIVTAIFCSSYLLIRYSAEVKQYEGDVLLALGLIVLALRTDPEQSGSRRFMLRWAVAGSVALWASMPSVFILSGVVTYYALRFLHGARRKYLVPLLLPGALWLIQFALYYLFVLRDQANSSYLQNFHREYFLELIPRSTADWKHNSLRIKELLGNAGSAHYYLLLINCLLMGVGVFAALRRRDARIALIAVPVVLTLLAAGLKQFSLIDRVALFLLPLLMLLIGTGLGELSKVRFLPIPVLTTLYAAAVLWFFRPFLTLREPIRQFQITEGLDVLHQKKAAARRVYIHDGSVPTFLYYTQIHPRRERYADLSAADLLRWSDDYSRIEVPLRDTAWFLFSGGFPAEEKSRRLGQLTATLSAVDSVVHETYSVYGFVRKAQSDTSRSSRPN